MLTPEEREARDERLQEKMNRLGTFGVGVDAMTAIAVTLDALTQYLVENGIIDGDAFNDGRIAMLEGMADNMLAQLGKPKLHVVK